jgi:hypothetical protein
MEIPSIGADRTAETSMAYEEPISRYVVLLISQPVEDQYHWMASRSAVVEVEVLEAQLDVRRHNR